MPDWKPTTPRPAGVAQTQKLRHPDPVATRLDMLEEAVLTLASELGALKKEQKKHE